MKMSEAFPSRFLRAGDLPEGSSISVVIDRVELEEVGDDGDQKPVIFFKGKKKGLVANKTNAMILADLYGDESDGWSGKPILLVTGKVMYGGKWVPCIRVQPPKKLAAPAASSPPPADPVASPEPPFAEDGAVDLENCPF